MTTLSVRHQKRDLTQGSIIKHVVRLAVPMTIGIGAIISYSIADVYFIGKLGSTELAAIGFTMPVTTLFFNMVFGLAIAMSAVVSRKIGAELREEIKDVASIGIALAFLVSAGLSFFGSDIFSDVPVSTAPIRRNLPLACRIFITIIWRRKITDLRLWPMFIPT